MPTIDQFDDNWYEFAGLEHNTICENAGPCHDMFILILDWNFYFDCVSFDWMRGE